MQNFKRIEFKKPAEKFLRSRSRKEQIRLLEKIYKLPDGEHVRKMEGYDNRYRLRVGDYRVLFELSSDLLDTEDGAIATVVMVVLVVDIGNRGDVYK